MSNHLGKGYLLKVEIGSWILEFGVKHLDNEKVHHSDNYILRLTNTFKLLLKVENFHCEVHCLRLWTRNFGSCYRWSKSDILKFQVPKNFEVDLVESRSLQIFGNTWNLGMSVFDQLLVGQSTSDNLQSFGATRSPLDLFSVARYIGKVNF